MKNIFSEITGSNPDVHKGKHDQTWLPFSILHDLRFLFNCFEHENLNKELN